MDRHRGGGGDRYGNSPNDSHPYRHPRGGGGGGPPPSRSSDDGPMIRHRGGFPGNRRPFDSSPPRYSLSGGGGGGGFHPMDGDGGFRPLGVRAARNYNSSSEFEVPLSGQKRFNPDYEVPMSGQKRQFSFPGRGGSPPDRFDGGNFEKRNFDGDNYDKRQVDVVNFDKKPAEGGSFAKLFVGSVPKTATEEDIRPVFEEHGNVVEVALIKDKRTGQQQGCCFIKYATSEDADRAIRALHNQYTLPGGMGPIQVRYADGERERLGNLPSTFAPCAVEFKLFVGSLNKQATEKEVEEIFLPYGRVEDVYLMRDEMKQSRGCGFVKYSNRDVAMAAINALNGIYIMRGCEQPLIVRFADPKRPRPGETRATPAFGGSGFGPRMQSPGIRPPNVGEMMHGSIPPNAWHPMSQQGMGPASDIGMHGFGGGQVGSRSSDGKVLSAPGGGGHGGVGDNLFPGAPVPSTTSNHQGFNPSLSQLPSGGQNLSPLKKQNQSPHLQTPITFSQPPPSTTTTVRPTGQHQPPPNTTTGQQPSFSQGFPSQPMPGGYNGMLPPQGSGVPSTTPPPSLSNNVPPHLLTAMMNQYQMPVPGQQQQSASPLAQMLTQQKQTLQASYQSSQQAFSQLQQQLQLMQPSPQQGGGGGRWPPQAASANPGVTPGKPVAEAIAPPVMPAGGPLKCSWTEHTSPDGYKYYYNSTTGESKWEKPEELALFEQQKPQEQQQQKQQTQIPSHNQGVPHQQSQIPSHSQGMPHQQSQGMPHQQSHSQGVAPHQQSQIPQMQLQNHLQTQMRHPQQMQHATQSSMYQNAGVAGHQNMQGYGYPQMPVAGGSMNDSARFQQGMQGGQEWMWKNKTAGPGS